jgi:hypothetical protein
LDTEKSILPASRGLLENKYVAGAAVVGFLLTLALSHGSLTAGLGVLALIAGLGWAERKIGKQHGNVDMTAETAVTPASGQDGVSQTTVFEADDSVVPPMRAAAKSSGSRDVANQSASLLPALVGLTSRQAQGSAIALPMLIGSFVAAWATAGYSLSTAIAATAMGGATGAGLGALTYHLVARRHGSEGDTTLVVGDLLPPPCATAERVHDPA